jgi:pyruvate,water dikinase
MGEKTEYVLWFETYNARAVSRVGSKNANLGEMTQAGLRVPPGFAVTKQAYERVVLQGGYLDDIEHLLAGSDSTDLASLAEVGKAVRRLVRSIPLPSDIEEAIRQAYQELVRQCQVPDLPVAVRSSATAEDLPGASFAGQQETYLWVRGADEVVQRMVDCWVSLFTDRAISYRARMGFPSIGLAISVGVQKMVNARAAGVMFTVNPVTGNSSQIVIEGNWGLGESIVQGMVIPDRYLVDKDNLHILEEECGQKTKQVVPTEHGTAAVEVPADQQQCLCLSHEEVKELAELARRVEDHYGQAMDIEWAVDADLPFPHNIFLLQTRPVTAAGPKAVPHYLKKEKDKNTTEHIIDLMVKGFRR